MALVLERDPGGEQFCDRNDDSPGREIFRSVVIGTRIEQTGVMTSAGGNQRMQRIEVLGVAGQQNAIRSDRVCELFQVTRGDKTDLSWGLEVVAIVSQARDQLSTGQIMVDVEPHPFSRDWFWLGCQVFELQLCRNDGGAVQHAVLHKRPIILLLRAEQFVVVLAVLDGFVNRLDGHLIILGDLSGCHRLEAE